MDLGVNKFLSLFSEGQASPSKYKIGFHLPKGIPSFAGSAPESREGSIQAWQSYLNGNEKINLLCHTCTMPQRSLMTYEHKQLNAPYRVPYSQSYEPITFSFYADADLDVRRYFEIWQNAVINIQSNTMNFYSEYISDITIEQLDKQGNSTYGVKLFECYPMSIVAIDYSYSNMNAMQNVTISMAYKYWNNMYDGRKKASSV